MVTTSVRRANYLSDEVGEAEFERAFSKLLAQVQKKTITKYLNPENTHRFKHGGQWINPAASGAIVGDITRHSSEAIVPFERILNHDLTVIDEVLEKLVNDMENQFLQTMYSTVSAAAKSVGNTIDGQSVGPPREAFAQMLERIQFSADRFGNVKLPEIHCAPKTAEEMAKSVADAPPEFHQRIEEIKKRKASEAIEREVERKSRFVSYGRFE